MKTSQLGFRISLFLATICLLAGFFVVPYQMESIKTVFGVEEYEKVMDSLQMPFFCSFFSPVSKCLLLP